MPAPGDVYAAALPRVNSAIHESILDEIILLCDVEYWAAIFITALVQHRRVVWRINNTNG